MIEGAPSGFDIVSTDRVMPGGYGRALAAQGIHGLELLEKPYTAQGLARVLQNAMAG